jgi:hypothetical protein
MLKKLKDFFFMLLGGTKKPVRYKYIESEDGISSGSEPSSLKHKERSEMQEKDKPWREELENSHYLE